MPAKRAGVQISVDAHAKLKEVARRNRMSLTAMLDEIIERYADSMKTRDEYEAELAKLHRL